MSAANVGFSMLTFCPDGNPVGGGLGFNRPEDLSSKWMDICEQFLRQNGPNFNVSWGGTLSRFETKMTSVASGVALVTFRVSSQIAATGMLLAGLSPAAEMQVTKMFVDSLMRVNVVQDLTRNHPKPFGEIVQTTDRPLMVHLPWLYRQIADEDHETVAELNLHLAAAWFRSEVLP